MMGANDAGEVAEMLESMTKGKLTTGEYEASENILHLWYPRRVELASDEDLQAFFDEVIEDWIRPCPNRPYLLVNFANLHIRPNMAEAYAKNIKRFQGMLLGTYRYGVPASFTGVAVALGNLKLASPANIFVDERTAREAIRVAKERASRRRKSG
jgi:hypothetical protein